MPSLYVMVPNQTNSQIIKSLNILFEVRTVDHEHVLLKVPVLSFNLIKIPKTDMLKFKT